MAKTPSRNLYNQECNPLAEVKGFEPSECGSQRPVPYHLATPQYLKLFVKFQQIEYLMELMEMFEVLALAIISMRYTVKINDNF